MRLTNFRRSLKGRLLGWLLFPLLLLSFAHLFSVYISTQRTSTDLFDRILVNLALSISEYAIASEGDLLTVELLELIHKTTNDKLYYKVLGPNGSFVVGYNDMPMPKGGLKQIDNHVELYDAVYLNEPVRVVAVSMLSEHSQFTGWTQAFVAQTIRDRNQYVMDAMVDNGFRVVLLIFIVGALLSIGIFVALKPLKKLQNALKYRDIHDLTHLETKELPVEIETLAVSINQLFNRLSNQIGLTKRFLENASHQLLTPIAALTLQCDMALRKTETDSGKQTLLKIKNNADQIARLAHQLLHLSYSEAAAFDKSKDELIDLADIARACISQLYEVTHSEPVNADLNAAQIIGNEILITQIFTNLLENAYKYGDKSVSITVSTYAENAKSILEVKDRGPGISPELRQLVTERFFRASNDQNGSGLGLAIVKEAVLIHHGEMEIRAGDNDKGTCIRCIFPGPGA